MLKYSFMSFSAPQLSLGELLTLAADLGYDAIEPRLASSHGHGIELESTAAQRQAIRAQAEASGVALCCLATSCKYADPTTAAKWVEETRRCIGLAADVGAPRLRVFGGALGAGLSRAQAITLVADSLATVADEAGQHGVTLCLETHDDWTDPAHVAAVIQHINHPAVGVAWDYMHTIRVAKKTLDEAFALLQPNIRHVHFHDGADRADALIFNAIGQGDYDNRRVVELLAGSGYDGYLSGEWINWEPYEAHLPRELAAIRAIELSVA
jgi:sugar phosphate isomerase/epimerase